MKLGPIQPDGTLRAYTEAEGWQTYQHGDLPSEGSIVRLMAPNDKNGNPRRLLLMLEPGHYGPTVVVREGYSGNPWGAHEHQHAVKIGAGEYRDTVRMAKNAGVFIELP